MMTELEKKRLRSSTEVPKITRPLPRGEVMRMTPYVPGEQPTDPNIIKLNTNENPYPPSPDVLKALRNLKERDIRCYSNPMASPLREEIASDLSIKPEQIIIGNGSDELLKLIALGFVTEDETVGFLWPTYSLYPVFVEQIGCFQYLGEWYKNGRTQEEELSKVPRDLQLFYLTNPNPPIGTTIDLEVIRQFAENRPKTVVVVDEAYIAYGGISALPLVHEKHPNIVVSRTFSKSHSLAGMRVGYMVGHEQVIDALYRIKDSYNVNAASQAAALASWCDREYFEETVSAVCATRDRVGDALKSMGFDIPPSKGNFLFARHANAEKIFKALRDKKIFVRYFSTPELKDGMRVTIGTDEEMDTFILEVGKLV